MLKQLWSPPLRRASCLRIVHRHVTNGVPAAGYASLRGPASDPQKVRARRVLSQPSAEGNSSADLPSESDRALKAAVRAEEDANVRELAAPFLRNYEGLRERLRQAQVELASLEATAYETLMPETGGLADLAVELRSRVAAVEKYVQHAINRNTRFPYRESSNRLLRPSLARGQPADLAARLEELLSTTPWRVNAEGRALVRAYQFKNFKMAMAFVNAVGTEADRANHHPRWENSYTWVTVVWETHRPKGVSVKDVEMAYKCEEIADRVRNESREAVNEVRRNSSRKEGGEVEDGEVGKDGHEKEREEVKQID